MYTLWEGGHQYFIPFERGHNLFVYSDVRYNCGTTIIYFWGVFFMKIRCQTDVKMTAWRYKILNSLLTSGRCRFDVGFSSPRLCCHHDYTAHQGICEGGVRFFQPCETEVEKINVRLTGEVEKNCDSQGGWTISGVSQWGRNFFRGRTTPQPVIKEHSLQYHWYVCFF